MSNLYPNTRVWYGNNLKPGYCGGPEPEAGYSLACMQDVVNFMAKVSSSSNLPA